ncbi:MAG TPA: hypothetical protein VG939_17645 [Caulobacteraceae bacterium]|nr:hypothetical protein [Caulobacteraceae bacterium]
MSLAAFQEALARRVRSPAAAGGGDRGLAVTAAVRRSWCEARTAKAGAITLSLLPTEARRRLIAEWVDLGGGAGAFRNLEAEAFLDFVAPRLPDPSHVLTLCRLEQALARAAVAVDFGAPPLPRPGARVARGRWASLVRFGCEPVALIEAALGGPEPPPLEPRSRPVFVAPGIKGRLRPAIGPEAALWATLKEPQPWREAQRLCDLRALLAEGVVEAV